MGVVIPLGPQCMRTLAERVLELETVSHLLARSLGGGDGKFVFPLSGVVPFNIFCAPLLSSFPRSLPLPSFLFPFRVASRDLGRYL